MAKHADRARAKVGDKYLSYANLQGVELSNTDLRRANLQGAIRYYEAGSGEGLAP